MRTTLLFKLFLCLTLCTWFSVRKALSAGENCSSAVIANVGSNSISANSGDIFWYTYTVQGANKKIMIESASEFYLDVYSNDCNNLYYKDSDNGGIQLVDLAQGDQVFLKWYIYNSELSWTLSEEDLVAGDNCSLAVDASLGANTVPSTSIETYWYTYTVQGVDKKISITSTADESVFVYSGDCDWLSYEANGFSDVDVVGVSQGEVLYIAWNTLNTDGNFPWTLAETNFETGDKCSVAATAVLGENNVPDVEVNNYWYSYTVQGVNKKLIVSSSSGQNVRFYKNTCEDLVYIGEGYEDAYIVDVVQGEEIFISWTTDFFIGSFSWFLAEEDLVTGDACSVAATASLGINHLPATDVTYYWYEYTVQGVNKQVVISNEAERYMDVITGTCGDLFWVDGDYDSILVNGVAQGETVFIRWSVYGEGDFDWNITEQDYQPGDICSVPLPAYAGVNYASKAPQWFTFTTPIDSDITISSVGFTTDDTYLRVYDACDSYPLDASDDYSGLQSQVTLTNVAAGTELFILWDDNFASGPFEWSLILDEVIDQVITFDPVEGKVYNEEFEINAVSNSGLDVSYALISGPATLTGKVVKTTGVGEVVVEATQGGNDYYNAASVQYSFNVAKANQVITISPIEDQQFSAGAVKVNATSSSNLEVSISVSGPAELNGDIITFKDYQGEVVVTASQAGNENYNAAENAVETFNIIPPAVAATNKSTEKGKIQISPNPSIDKVRISYGLKTVNKIRIVDVKGLVVLEVNASPENTIVNIEGLRPGFYIVNLDSGENQRLIIK